MQTINLATPSCPLIIAGWLAISGLLLPTPPCVGADSPAKDAAGTEPTRKMATASAENEGAVVDISVSKSSALGQPAMMVITIRNKADDPFYCMEMHGLPNTAMTMELHDSRTNDAIEMTQHGKDTFRQFKIGGSVGIDRLDKGMQRSWSIDLADFFKLRRGNFRFIATFRLNRRPKKEGQPAYIKVIVAGPDFSISD